MKKLSNWIIKGSVSIFRILYLFLGVGVILALAYILGGRAFLMEGRWGSDMGSALSVAAWVDKYFPHVPFWYPLAGGGVSITHSYPVFSFYLVALLKRLTNLDLVQAFRVLGFSSVPLMALGIYAFVALRFSAKGQRSQTAALIASILYLVSPLAWVWLFDWGFYAECISHIFVMPAVIFWDLFFTSFLEKIEGIKNRVYLVLAVVFLSLALLAHFYTGLGLMMLFGFYLIGYVIKAKEKRKVFIRGVLALSLVVLLTFGLTISTTFPFYRYAKITAEAGVAGKSYQYFRDSKMTVDHILGFRPLTEEYRAARNISFPAVVSGLAILGIFLSLWEARSFTLALFTIVALVLFFNPDFLFWISSRAPQVLAETLNRRPPLVLLRFILPTLAGLGVIRLFKIPFFWVKGRLGNFAKGVFASLGGLVLVIGALYWFGSLPNWENRRMIIADWPKLEVTQSLYDPSGKIGQLKETLNRVSSENSLARLDFSVYLGQLGMSAPYFNRDRSLSQTYIYVNTASLIRQFWNQLINGFYSENFVSNGSANLVNNLARWFGVNYVFFNGETDSRSFQEAGWEVWEGSWEKGILKFPEENSLANLTTKPTVLVIGQKKVDVYYQVFQLAAYGVLPYPDYLIVWGRGAIDDYHPEELANFDLLLLHGYTYKNRQEANELLADYVKGGGNVFIDTGWQYTTPDWETKSGLETLAIIPFNQLLWKNLGKTDDFVFEESELSNGVDLSQFAPLIYEDQPWGVSTNKKTELKNWPKVVLSVQDYPLIVAGELGEGKVVWSGMNIFPHLRQKEEVNYEEVKFLANLFSWLTNGNSREDLPVTYRRENPDRLEFTVEEDVSSPSFLLWKEAFHPDFRATLASDQGSATQSLDVYRAGPNLALISLPEIKKGAKIIYEYRQPFSEKALSLLSWLIFLFLPAMVIEGVWLKEKSLFWRLIKFQEKKLDYLIFELWKKPVDWWRREE